MKSVVIYLITVIGFIGTSKVTAQPLPDSVQRAMIDSLGSANKFTVMGSLNYISNNDLNAAVPKMVSTFYRQTIWNKEYYLRVLFHLQDSNFVPLAWAFIDSAGYYERSRDSLILRIGIVEKLIDMKDTSRLRYLMEYYRLWKPTPYWEIMLSLPSVAKLTRTYDDSALSIFREATIHGDSIARAEAIEAMVGCGLYDTALLIDRALHESSASTRAEALRTLCNARYVGLETLLDQRMRNDSDWYVRSNAAELLLNHCGSIKSYSNIVHRLKLEPNEYAANEVFELIAGYRPKVSDSTQNLTAILDSLESAVSFLNTIGWMTGPDCFTRLDSAIRFTQSSLASKDTSGCFVALQTLEPLSTDGGCINNLPEYVLRCFADYFLLALDSLH